MAYGDGVELNYAISDAKGKATTFGMNFPGNVDIPLLTGDFAPSTAEILDKIIDGKIEDASASINVNLNGVTLKTAPLPGCDIEEGAIFTFRSTVGAPTTMRIPTFDEEFGLETGDAVDLSAEPVDDFVQRIIQGDTQGATTVRWTDSHGNNVAGLTRAADSFKKSKRK